ncbi:hypothetical protein DJ71_07525 [Halorubrum sp. E3]|uniref:DUF7981 domain-containing protein n=1 Tax=Halorubrum persicum TaxID=1383844 RepID=A0A2G1WH98_9EURY|nr:hypothetical protein [Halorubrum persicum]OYR85612.1 hypothetical protein DJ71_07525 [Halorubrum sp. E3]PHQ38350.1 hypothetical protein DJ69_12070 [Halorubrum persicum]
MADDSAEGTADRPGVPATPRARVRSAALWGLVGGFAFLVLAQGYLLVIGGLPVGYVGLFVLAGGIAVASGGIAYAVEHRLHAKRRT